MKPRPSARSAFGLVLTCAAVMSTVLSSTAAGRVTATGSAAAAAPAWFTRPACAAARPGHEQCFLAYRPQTAVNHAISAGLTGQAVMPQGLGARDLRAAYKLPSRQAPNQTVAVSIAFHTPRLAHFLAVYRKQFGLPTCTVASGCFRVVNQLGQSAPLPPSAVGSGWDLEAALDVSMISAACPHCRILVVEGNNDTIANLAVTERTAARLGAQVISNSYGHPEDGFSLRFNKAYERPGHTIVVAGGDEGFGPASSPANLATVTSVGGTTLARAANRRGWREQVWKDNRTGFAGGSGCSAYIAKPAWQHDGHCPMRTVADVSAVAADVPVFDSTYGGWVTVAGTSISAPLVAGIYGLAGNGARTSTRRLYRQSRSFFDITRGDNSLFVPARRACGGDYLCIAKKGYDAPTGLGSPDGISAF